MEEMAFITALDPLSTGRAGGRNVQVADSAKSDCSIQESICNEALVLLWTAEV